MHSSQDILQELLPGASELEISSALEKAGGDVEEAAQSLLGLTYNTCFLLLSMLFASYSWQ